MKRMIIVLVLCGMWLVSCQSHDLTVASDAPSWWKVGTNYGWSMPVWRELEPGVFTQVCLIHFGESFYYDERPSMSMPGWTRVDNGRDCLGFAKQP